MTTSTAMTVGTKAQRVFISLQVLDILTTLLGFKLGASEANPMLVHLFHTFGVFSGLIIGKLVVSSAIFLYLNYRDNPKLWTLTNFCFRLLIVSNLIACLRLMMHWF